MFIKRDKLDVLFSEYIRKRAVASCGGCERCLKPYPWQSLQTSHFWGRRMKSVRWHELNAAGLCFSCHQHLTANPAEHVEWFKKRLGAQYEMLDIQAHQVFKPDISGISLYLEQKIRELGKVILP